MALPEITRLKEPATQSQFRIALPDPEALYHALDRNQPTKGNFNPILEIGSLHAESGLFSQITVQANMLQNIHRAALYSISASLTYQNPDCQYWPDDQAKQLQRILNYDYGIRPIKDRNVGKGHLCLLISDHSGAELYQLHLGHKNEKTAWKDQVQRDYEALININAHGPLTQTPDEESLKRLMTIRYPIALDALIEIKPIYAHLWSDETQKIKAFIAVTQKWSQFIVDTVNAMAKVKGIPQSGKLTLLPPSEIPQ